MTVAVTDHWVLHLNGFISKRKRHVAKVKKKPAKMSEHSDWTRIAVIHAN